MRWAIVGTGNVAWHLAQVLSEAGEQVSAWISREQDKAEALLQSLPLPAEAYSWERWKQANMPIDVYVLAVADDYISSTALQLSEATPTAVVHTSGTRALDSLHALAQKGWHTGIFYPLQTLSIAKKIDWAHVPLLLEASHEVFLQQLAQIARKISQNVAFVRSEQRVWLHLVAVMTANFTHHLCTIGDKILKNEDLSFSLLIPLLQETMQKALQPNPALTQTGPARRGDAHTVAKHIALLENYPAWKKVYEALSESIGEMYHQASS